jgi:hypothetical protein
MYIYLLIFLLLIYTSFYYIFIDEISIYQVSINNFDFELLYKKQPIVISDYISDINYILANWFNYNIIYNLNNNYIWQKNKYKYLFVQSIPDNPAEIYLCNPSSKITNGIPDKDSNITSILLNNKSIIIPFNWNYYISGNTNMYGIHDYITICTAAVL